LQQQSRQEIGNALTSQKALDRAHAIEALKDTSGAAAADLIVKHLADTTNIVRFASAMAAGELKLEQARQQLLVASDDKDANVRVAAKFALHRLGDTRQSRDLEKASLDTNPLVRGNVAVVLGLIGDPTARRVLFPMLADSAPAVRLQAAEALWRLGNERGLEVLVGATISKFPDDQMMGTLGLAAPRESRVLGHIVGNLTADYDEVSLVAARAAGMVGSDAGYGVAMKGAHSTDPRQRMLAAWAFGAIGRSDAQDYLGPLLKDPDSDVRLAAATAILQLKSP
jgi:HEAT repeat protein